MPYLEALRSAVPRGQCANSTKAWKHCTAATWNAAVVHAGLALTLGHSAWRIPCTFTSHSKLQVTELSVVHIAWSSYYTP